MTFFPSSPLPIDGQTRVVAVIGWPVRHSLSPPMQNAAMRALGLNWVYVPLAVNPARLRSAIDGARAMNFVGLNCTIPHKETVLSFLDMIDPVAKAIGAVNTIKISQDGTLTGYNTDCYGFVSTLMAEGEFLLRDSTVLILGAGGAARGIAAGAAIEGAHKVIIANRTRDRADSIARDLEAAYPDTRWEIVQYSDASLRNATGRSQVIVNATSLGMRPTDPLPFPEDMIAPEHVIFDTVYAPKPDTPLLLAAKARGAIPVGGLGMLARQGAKALSIWSGLQPDEDLMLSVLQQHFR